MKKVLSFVLILALVLGSFSFAFGLTDVADADANSDAITVANNLGIVTGYEDGSFKADQAVNRAEFAAMITRAMAVPESALAGFSATTFKDTAGYGWAVPYLAFCESKGIMIGDGQGNVMPGRTINVNEAMTMVVRTLGYTENSALLVGTWPSKYVTVAQDLGLYDDIAAMTTVNRGNAAQVIYNALTVQKVQVDADGQTTGLTKAPGATDVTLLNSGLNCEAVAAAVIYGDEDSVINIKPFVGVFASVYENSDGEIVAISKVDSVALTGSFDTAIADVKVAGNYTGVIFETLDEVEYSFSLAGGTIPGASETFVNNNKALAVGAADALATTDEVTLNVDLSGKTIKSVYSVEEWSAQPAFLFDADMLDDDALYGYDFELDDNDKIDFNSFVLNGAASLEAIAEDDVVEVYTFTNTAAGDIARIDVGTEKVTGKITLNDGTEWTIDGVVYEAAGVVLNNALALGDTGTADLNYAGEIAKWTIDDASADNYGVITGVHAVSGRDDMLKIMDINGVEKDYVLDNGIATLTLDGSELGFAAPPYDATDLVLGDLVTFDVNKDGKIDKLVAKKQVGNTDVVATSINAAKTIYGAARVDKAAVVFTFDGATLTGSTDFEVVSLADVEDDTVLTGAEVYQDGAVIEVLFVNDSFTGGKDSVFALASSNFKTFNSEDDNIFKITGFADGKAYTGFTDDRSFVGTVLNAEFKIKTVNPANLVAIQPYILELTVDSNGVVTDAKTAVSVAAVVNGTVTDIYESYTIEVGAGNWVTIDPATVIYKYVSADKEFKLARITDVRDGSTGKPATNVMLYQMDKDSETYDFVVIWD